MARALGVAPDQFVGVAVWRIVGQIMQGQFAGEFRDILGDSLGFVRRQSIQDQIQGPTTTAQHPAQQCDEPLAVQARPD